MLLQIENAEVRKCLTFLFVRLLQKEGSKLLTLAADANRWKLITLNTETCHWILSWVI
jgi:hypothetical protein